MLLLGLFFLSVMYADEGGMDSEKKERVAAGIAPVATLSRRRAIKVSAEYVILGRKDG